LAEVNGSPQLSAIEDPALIEEARVVRMPMPEPVPVERGLNSLWATNKRSFFADQRANDVGDILTVDIEIADNARLRNSTARTRDNSESLGLAALFGAEQILDNALADSFEPDNAVEIASESQARGAGEINRNEEISLRIAAVVTERLPNGHFVIAGRQEVRVNHELRELRIAGVIRPEDIAADNSIDYFKIAEARISYGGRGTISRVQKPKPGQRLYEAVIPY
jgi:flagellar L-ring protein precursor FlgH